MDRKMKCALSIAGSDSGAGAGIQSDLKTFHNHGVYGLSVITAITAQNTFGVQKSFEIPAGMIDAQLKSVFDDFEISTVKIGMLSSESVIKIIAKYLRYNSPLKKGDKGGCYVIIDPVILSKNKHELLNKKGVAQLKAKLISLSYLITPNLYEAEILSGIKIKSYRDIEYAAKIIFGYGCKNVLIKGGHFQSGLGIEKGTDILYDGKSFIQFKSDVIKTKNTHGIGCVLSSAIASNLALGKNLNESIIESKSYILKQLKNNIKIGKGTGPVEK
jgi:hydroxymethylpyrimidine/phosphomethylpyrimidine kinase